jgi:membrane-associated phospholipid phosphatase
LRVAEWIQLAFVTLLSLAAWIRPLGPSRRIRVSALALIAIAAIVIARYSVRWLSPLASSVLRDWLPAALLLVPYWQVGQFFTSANSTVEYRLAAFDRSCFAHLGIKLPGVRIRRGLALYLQFAYLMVYPLIPLGLVTLYLSGLRNYADHYWIVVLAATYLCFAVTLFIPALPPRLLAGYPVFPVPATKVGLLNQGILRRASIQAITFPSAHVASAIAAALAILRLEPWAGLIFLWMALSIAVATVVGGYHYAADVLLAIVIAVLVFGATACI